MENVPIYVKVDKYKEVLETLRTINERLASVNKTVERINALKAQEDQQLQAWTENLTDIRNRLERINNSFYES